MQLLIMFVESKGKTVHLLKQNSKPVSQRAKKQKYELYTPEPVPQLQFPPATEKPTQSPNFPPDPNAFVDVSPALRSKRRKGASREREMQ